jgi:mRNA interferase RelE/StbE
VALIIRPQALRQLEAVPRNIAARLRDRLEHVAEDPFGPQPGVKPMVGEVGSFRVRQGAWRAVYFVEDGHVIVARVGHRREVYR